MMIREGRHDKENKFVIEFGVNRPADEVFRLISDIPKYNEWVPGNSMIFLGTTITPGCENGEGTAYEDRLRFGGISIGKVVRCAPPERFSMVQITRFCVPIVTTVIDYVLRDAVQGTVVTHTATVKMHGVYKLMRKVHLAFLKRERRMCCQAMIRQLDSARL